MVLALTSMKPSMGVQISAGVMILLIAFSSVPAALYLLIFSMLLSPEYGGGQVQGHGVGGRAISVRGDDILLIVIGLTWLVKTTVFHELALIKYTPINRPILYYTLACILATLLGVVDGRVKPLTGFLFVLKYFEYFLVFFMVVNNVTTRSQMVKLLVALLATCFLISLYAIAQVPSGVRASAPFEGETGEPNTLGGYLVFLMAVMIGLLLHVPSPFVRMVLLILLGLSSLALMATLSRVSFLAAGVLLITVMFTQRHRPGVVAVILFVMALLPVLAPGNVKQRVSETFYGRQYGGEIKIGGAAIDLSTTERLRSWQRILRDWAKKPIFGYGVTGYAWADVQYVRTLGETGLVGFVAFCFLIYRLWRAAWEAFLAEVDPVCKGVAYGFILGLVAVLGHSVGANSFIIIRIMEPFWLFAGFVMLLPTLEGKEERHAVERTMG
jgi:O-antigen ligase